MNSGIRVRESIRLFAYAFDARGRLTEGRSMDRDLGTPKKSQASAAISAELVCVAAGLAMKQTRHVAGSGSNSGFVQSARQR
jgi:hypothetical protein